MMSSRIFFANCEIRSIFAEKFKYKSMATPIKPTPILTGKDSRRFAKEIENVQKISHQDRAEYEKAYEWFKRSAMFSL